jgi:hypothetical protein
MLGLIKPIFGLVLDLFRSRAALEAEMLVLRQQIIVLRRGRVGRLPFSASDRVVLGLVRKRHSQAPCGGTRSTGSHIVRIVRSVRE